MASLMEEFLDVLEKENEEYTLLFEIANEKTPVIISGDIQLLNEMTEKEQVIVDQIGNHEKKRMRVLKDIGEVLGQDVESLKLTEMIRLFEKQPNEQKKLIAIHNKLKQTLQNMNLVNEQNKALIEQSLEMVTFDINLLNSLKQAPATANYNKNAANTGDVLIESARFDTKQ